jgi:threonine 3-dehydrogenase
MLRRATTTSAITRTIARRAHGSLPDFTKPRILVTGANGQIGSELVDTFRAKFGVNNVVATDIRKPAAKYYQSGPFEFLNVLDKNAIEKAIVDHGITWVIHLSAIMSVLGEAQPQKCIELNVQGLTNVLELARVHQLRCFAPSTMAVFSPESGKVMTKDDTMLNPTTVYGITKVFLEQLGAYYARKFDVDFRCVRYPGIISADTLPGGGTTDYAVWMYHYALENKKYTSPVLGDEPLPMMYMPDCLNGTVDYICAPREKLSRNVYNLAGFSFTPNELKASINKVLPNFEVAYHADVAQTIAASWPDSMDDSNARKDFHWQPQWNLDTMTRDMLKRIATMKGLETPKGL